MQQTVTSEQFIGDITRVLSEGSANSTMKWLLLLALVDAAPLLLEDDSEIALGPVADAAFGLLRPQLRPHPQTGTPLSQDPHPGMEHRLLRIMQEDRGAVPSEGTRAKIAWHLTQWPVPRLQRIGGETISLLWTTPKSWDEWFTERTAAGKGTNKALPRRLFDVGHGRLPTLEALPGAIKSLVRLGPLIRPAIELRWSDQVSRMNRQVSDPQASLRHFLFPTADRFRFSISLRNDLAHLQRGRCFWCGRSIEQVENVEVDHVVPWSISHNDAIENLVLTCAGCNSIKSNWLPSPQACSIWLEHLNKNSSRLVELATRHGLRSARVMSISWMRALYVTVPSATEWRAFHPAGKAPSILVLDPAAATGYFDAIRETMLKCPSETSARM